MWRTETDDAVNVARCDEGFCFTLLSSEYSGRQIGHMALQADGGYAGIITDPSDNKSYDASASVKGDEMELAGCALVIFCQTQTWHRLAPPQPAEGTTQQ